MGDSVAYRPRAAGAGSNAPPRERHAAHGERGPAGGERRAARAGPRAGSPAGADLGQFLAAALVGSTPGTAAPEGPAVRPEARRTARTPRDVPCPAAGRADRRGGSGRPRGLPALSAAVSGIHQPLAGPGLAPPG